MAVVKGTPASSSVPAFVFRLLASPTTIKPPWWRGAQRLQSLLVCRASWPGCSFSHFRAKLDKKETYFLELIWYLVGMLFRWQGYRHRGGTDVIYTLIIIWMRVQIGLFRGLGITWTAFLLIFIPSERPGPPDIFKSPAPSWWHTEFYDSKQSSEALSTDAIQHCAFTLFFSLCSGLIRNISKIKLNLNNFFW